MYDDSLSYFAKLMPGDHVAKMQSDRLCADLRQVSKMKCNIAPHLSFDIVFEIYVGLRTAGIKANMTIL